MHIGKRALALAIVAACAAQISVSSATADTKHAQEPRASALSGGSSPHFKYPQHAKPNGGSVLYDQTGPYDNGVPDQYFQSSLGAYDSQAADDFVVTDSMGWSVSAFNFEVQFVDSNTLVPPPPNATYDITVYADAAGMPGASVCTYSGLVGSVDVSNTNLSVALPSTCVLPQGSYWVSLTSDFDYPPQAFWANAAGAPIGADGVWRNPGGGFGTACSDWSDVATCANSSGAIGAGYPNFLFQVIGAAGGGGCDPNGICLVSTVGTDLTPDACASTDTIDATIGDQLNFCYTVTNNSAVDLDYQTLQNNIDGTLFLQSQHALLPGDSYQFNHIETVGATHTYSATWTAQDVPSGYIATVENGGGNCGDRIFADGFENSLPACAGGNFVDITNTGIALFLSDDGSADLSMPFSFNFYGTTSNILTVANNGGAFFNSPGAYLVFDNEALPSANLFAPAILPLWDNFDVQSGDVYVDTRGTAPNRQFIVEWFNRVHYDGTLNADGATFELIVNEDGTLQFEYDDVGYTAFGNGFGDPDDCTDGVCATIGLQNDATLFNQYSAFAAAVTDHSGIKWTPANPTILTASDTTTVNVGAPEIAVSPSPIAGTVSPGGTSTIPFAIENLGNRDLQWTLDEAAPSNLHFPPPGTRFAMPLGDPAKRSLGPAPRLATTRKGARDHVHVPFAPGSIETFAADLIQQNLETFDARAPQTVDIVAPVTDGTAYTGGAFIDGDFSTFYAIAGPFGANPDDLFAIDTTTGAPTLIGNATNPLGEGYQGLAYDSTTQQLYAESSDCNQSHLWKIDPATGAPTEVGETTGASCVAAIAVNALGEMYALDLATDALWAIDKTTGDAQLIGSIGFNSNFSQDMAFDPSTGILYLAGFDADSFTDNMYTVDLNTGFAQIIATINASLGDVDAMAIETVGGPCWQPQDLPWLSLSATSGTTPPLGSSPITAMIDGTGASDGDVLSGTICAASNDPAKPLLATPITVNVSSAPPLLPPALTKTFSPQTVAAGESSALTIGIDNGMNPVDVALTAPMTDAFPPGLVVAAVANATSTCGGTVTANPGDDAVTLGSDAVLPAIGSCFVTVDVVAASEGSYANTIPPGALQTAAGQNSSSADATLDVTAAVQLPTLSKFFSPASIAPGGTSTLTITLGNGNAAAAPLTAALTDAFPIGLVVAPTPNASSDCGGAVTANVGADSVSLDSASSVIPGNGACMISVDVTAAADGPYANSIPVGALQTLAGSNATSADATLNVAGPPQPIPPTATVAMSPTSIAAGASSTLTLTFANDNAGAATLSAPLTEPMPLGVTVATTPNRSTTCGGTLTANAGDDVITLDASGAAIPGNGTCAISVDVTAASAGVYVATFAANALQTSVGNNAVASSDNIVVTGAFPAPYCATSDSDGVEPITNVDFAGIVNASSATLDPGGSATESQDFLAIVGGSVAPGAAYAISVQGNTNGDFKDFFRVYFDWNHDGVFAIDGSESVDVGMIENSTGTDALETDNVVLVPASAKHGLTRVRVVKARSFLGQACGNNSDGQSEDYLVDVDPAAPQPPVPPLASSTISPNYLSAPNQIATLTIALTNDNANDLALTGPMIDSLPSGLVVASPANASTTCAGGSALAIPGDATFSLGIGATIPTHGSCTISVDITSTTPGIYVNTLSGGAITTANGGNPQPSSVTVQVADPSGAPTYGVDFEPPSFALANLDGQAGWFAQSNVAQPAIVGAAPAHGLQHAALTSTSSTSTLINPLAISPEQLAGTSLYSVMSANVRISRNGNGSNWQFIPNDTTAGQVATIVEFDKAATRKITVIDFSQGTFIDTGATWPIDTYFNIEIDIERANGTIVMCKDGAPIYLDDTGVSVGGWNVTQAILQQDLASGSTAGNSMFVDDLAVDNPIAPACAEAAGLLKAPPKPPGTPVHAQSSSASIVRPLTS